jgi:crotonobetainyl-CoA:carnitine CoA-transferase CaiB-like acyl-CoA transferase
VLAGPLCTMMLGDNGADVVKVEAPGGDATRQWGPPFVRSEGPPFVEESAYYLFCNRSKRSIVVDLSTPEGQDICRVLASEADVVVENFRPGTLERWGLDYPALKQLQPRLIFASISGFGGGGPLADLPAYDVMGQAMGGLMSITGEPNGEPTRVGIAIADITTGLFALIGILLALAAREQTGEGQHVRCSLLESVVSLLTHVGSNYLLAGAAATRQGNTHPSIVPYQIFAARDRTLYVAVGTDRQFRSLCDALGHPELAENPDYTTNRGRVENREALLDVIESALVERTAEEWLDAFRVAGVPAAPILTVDEVLNHPQTEATEMVQALLHPVLGQLRFTGFPVKLDATPGRMTSHPPLHGEHTREILAEAGYGADLIAALERRAVVQHWTPPA